MLGTCEHVAKISFWLKAGQRASYVRWAGWNGNIIPILFYKYILDGLAVLGSAGTCRLQPRRPCQIENDAGLHKLCYFVQLQLRWDPTMTISPLAGPVHPAFSFYGSSQVNFLFTLSIISLIKQLDPYCEMEACIVRRFDWTLGTKIVESTMFLCVPNF